MNEVVTNVCDKLVKKLYFTQTTDTSNLVKKIDYYTDVGKTEQQITDHDHNSKYITTQGLNSLTAENFVHD